MKRILAIQKIPKVVASSIDGRPLFLFTYLIIYSSLFLLLLFIGYLFRRNGLLLATKNTFFITCSFKIARNGIIYELVERAISRLKVSF